MFEYILVQDANGQNLVKFVTYQGTDRIIAVPFEALFHLRQLDPDTPLWVQPGREYTPQLFLGLLARFAALDTGDGRQVQAHSKTATVQLTRHLQAAQLAQLTGYDPAVIRDLLRDHLTFGSA